MNQEPNQTGCNNEGTRACKQNSEFLRALTKKKKKSASEQISNMPRSSRSTWLKSILPQNGAKLLLTSRSSKPLTHATFKIVPDLSDKLSIIFTAPGKVSSIAARAVLDVVKAQAGASTTSNMALRTADELSRCTKEAARLAVCDERCARDVAKSTAHPTQAGLPVAMDLKPRAARISRWAQKCDADSRVFVDKINRAEGKYAKKSPHHRASMAAALTALAEIACIVADVVEARIAISIAAPTVKSVPSVKELTSAIDAAATQAAFAVAEAATLVDRGRPPPYENL